MVEGVEGLRQSEGEFGQHGELQRTHDLIHYLIETGGFKHEGPQTVKVVIIELLGPRRVEPAHDVGFRQPLAFLQLVKDIIGAHHSILQIGTGLAFEAQRLFDVEHNQLTA